MNSSFQFVVIGGGLNGLTAATVLARFGRKVLLLDQNETLGGTAASEEFHPGYFHAGLLHDTSRVSPAVVKQLELAQHGLQRHDSTPPLFAPQPAEQGKGLLLYTNPEQAAVEIGHLSSNDAKQYKAFRSFLQSIEGFVQSVAEQAPPPLIDADTAGVMPLFRKALSLRLLGKERMMQIIRAIPMNVEDWLGEWFETDLLKAALAAPAVYGSFTGPRSPATCAPFLLRECTSRQPIRGGAPALVQALRQSAEARGVTILTGTEVTEVLLQEGRACGVRTSDGSEYKAKAILSTCDPKRTLLELLPRGTLPYITEQRMLQYRARGTTAKIHLALSQEARFACRPEHTVEYARIGENLVELEKAHDASKYREFSTSPILDLFVPTVSNPSLAPEGHSVMSILVHFAPYNLKGGWSDEQKTKLGDIVVQKMEAYIPGFSDTIVGQEILSPLDLEQKYGLTGGHIYHGELGLDQLLVRPIPECARFETPVPGLFLGSSGCHGGFGLTCGPGALAAKAAIQSNPL